MDSYRIEWKSSAEKEVKAIDRQHIPRILEAMVTIYHIRHRKDIYRQL